MSREVGVPPKIWLYSLILHLVVSGLGLTYRIHRFDGKERLDRLKTNSEPVILSAWHNRIFYLSILIRKQLIRKGVAIAMMSSLSKDGTLGALLAERIGARVVRGSTSRGGTQGIRRFYRLMKKEGCSTIILPDGSKGPIYEAKMGVAMLAKLTGAPVVPMSYWADRFWRVPSWDRLIIPKPFARISIVVGEVILVDREIDETGLENSRKHIEKMLNELNARAVGSFENKG